MDPAVTARVERIVAGLAEPAALSAKAAAPSALR
jgi:hypothetical protein